MTISCLITGATRQVAYPSGAPVFTVVSRVHVTQSIVFCVVLSMSLFVIFLLVIELLGAAVVVIAL
jgi:hypothetical protein